MPRRARLHPGWIALGLGLVLLVALAPAEARPAKKVKATPAKTSKQRVRIGLVKTLFRDVPESLAFMAIQPFKTLMETQSGVSSQLVNAGDYDKLAQQLDEEKVQLGVFHGTEYAWARQTHPDLKPLIIAVNEKQVLRAHLVVRADRAIGGPGDLKGTTLSLPFLSREHCRLFLERRCTQPGVSPWKHYGDILRSGDAEDGLDAVVDGKVQAAVIDEVALDSYRRFKPDRAGKLRSLLQSEPMPCAVVVYKTGVVSDEMLEQFREGMLSSHKTPKGKSMLQTCRITSFAAIPDDYDQLLNDVAKAFPPQGN